jgi:hypothetical protein
MNPLEKIFDNLFVRLAVLSIGGFVLLFIGGYLLPFNFPTHEINTTISVNERQTQCGTLNCIYYIITPENRWIRTSYDMYPKLQPNHTYEVVVRLPNCNEGAYQTESLCGNNTGTIISILKEVI